jgi:hypothetical protein
MAKEVKKVFKKIVKRKLASKATTIIVPSTKLLAMGVHKLQDLMYCDRYFFWRWVLNFVSKKISLPLWFGSMMHEGLDVLTIQRDLDKALAAMDENSRKDLNTFIIDSETMDELEVQRAICSTLISTFWEIYSERIESWEVVATERKFSMRLRNSPILFEGTLDAYGRTKNILNIREYKSALRLNAQYFERLKFDKQINGYALGVESIEKKIPGYCDYWVFRKPSIKPHKNEDIEDYIIRFEADLHDRSDWYYLTERIVFGKDSVNSVRMDIEGKTFDLWSKYNYFSEEQILNPDNWPRNDRACFTYGVCPYLLLCRNCSQYKLYSKFYKMRDIRYDTENGELNEKYALDTNECSRAKINNKMLNLLGDSSDE